VLGHYDAKYDSTLRVFEGWWNGWRIIRFVRNQNGNLYVPYLIEVDGKVVLNWNWLDNNWNSNNPALRFRNSLHFSSTFFTFVGEFCLPRTC
jgi:hypothetical protein